MRTEQLVKDGRWYVRLTLFAMSLIVSAAAVASPVSQKIDELVTTYAKNGVFNGSVLVARSGDVLYSAGHGVADKSWNIQNRTDTRYLIGSATKLFTSLIILRLVEEGTLQLDKPISSYLPGFQKKYRDIVTIRQLLSQTSGIPDYYTREFHDHHKDRYYSHEEFVDRFIEDDLVTLDAGTGAYSSANYYILGLIIEAVAQTDFSGVLHAKVLEPLNLDDSGYDHHTVVETGLATGYVRNYLGYQTAQYEIVDSSAFAAGAMYSTVGDMFKASQALQRPGLLSQESIDLLQTPVATTRRGQNAQFTTGAGISSLELPGSIGTRQVQEFAGNTSSGYTAINTHVLGDDVFVSILANAGPGYFDNRLHKMKRDIFSIVYGEQVPVPERHLAAVLGVRVAKGQVDDIVAEYHTLTEKGSYSSNEQQLNQLGYDLLGAGYDNFAIAIFELNIENHPASANAHDSLAEAYLRAGMHSMALDSYSRVMTLNPTARVRENAEKMIASLLEKQQSAR